MSTYFTGMLLVYIFPAQYTILLSGTLYVVTFNCLMSTYFTGMLLVYIFHGKLFYFLVQLYLETSNCLMSTYFTDMPLV